ncbi:hypothetical protein AURDEDRAFT_188827 [Auricularia subglabra TFB-10046 SS5]|uniref:MYND-type domain-containing protein n=1 Tax=Auricularia subglabra (strain TFB-10046 / SS5) TaxID=717982 RepID=J0WSJ1_AURST|nr:hypothetical protein AURDEDRAFT_188827 [Auricularia subglabra TFB-10046 SS5]
MDSQAGDDDTLLIEVDPLRHLMEVLMPQLTDPQYPRCCPRCFVFFIHMICRPDSAETLSHLLVHNHDLFDASVAFLVFPRTVSDLPVLMAQLDRNHDLCSTKDWHYIVKPNPAGLLHQFLVGIHLLIGQGFEGGVKKKGWFKSRARKGTWPISPQQLLPRGDLASTAAYVFWCRALVSPIAMPLLIGLLEAAREHTLPHLLVSPQRELLMETIIVMLHGDPGTTPPACGIAAHPSLWLERINGALPPQTAALLIRVIGDGHGVKPNDTIQLMHGYDRALYPALISVLDSALELEEATLICLCSFAAVLHDRLRLPKSHLHWRILWWKAKKDMPDDINVGVQLLILTLQNQSASKRCAGPACSALGKQACGQCKFIQYCGRNCQRADWKTGRAQVAETTVCHKIVCPLLCRLFDAGAHVDKCKTPRQFLDSYRRANISEFEAILLLAWGISARLLPTTLVQENFGDIIKVH